MLANKLLHKFTLVPYDEDMYDEFAAGSLILINWRTADALVEATTHALQDGSLKRVGILFMLDTEALASKENLLKVNLLSRSMWGGGLILIKPKTSRCKKERKDSCIVPYRDIPEIAVEINKAFVKLQMLLINNRRPAKQLNLKRLQHDPKPWTPKRGHGGQGRGGYRGRGHSSRRGCGRGSFGRLGHHTTTTIFSGVHYYRH